MKLKLNNSEAGYTLAGVLVVFTLLAVLGMSITMMTLASVKTSTVERDDQSAFYIAEAGLNYELKRAEVKAEQLYEEALDFCAQEYEGDRDCSVKTVFLDKVNAKLPTSDWQEVNYTFETVNGVKPTAKYKIERIKDGFKISSIGDIEDQSRLVEQTFGFDPPTPPAPSTPNLPNLTVATKGDLDIDIAGQREVNGKVGSVKCPLDKVEGIDEDKIICIPEEDFPNIPLPNIPNVTNTNYLNNTIDKDTDIKNLEIKSTGNKDDDLIIETNGQEINVIANNLILKKGSVVIKGNGHVNFYIKGNLIIEDGKFYKAGSQDRVASNEKLNIFMYKNNAEFNVKNGGTFVGNVFVISGKKIDLMPSKLGIKGLIYAPNAEVMYNGGDLEGMVISKSFKMRGNGTITYMPITLENFPSNGNHEPGEPPLENGSFMYKDPLREIPN